MEEVVNLFDLKSCVRLDDRYLRTDMKVSVVAGSYIEGIVYNENKSLSTNPDFVFGFYSDSKLTLYRLFNNESNPLKYCTDVKKKGKFKGDLSYVRNFFDGFSIGNCSMKFVKSQDEDSVAFMNEINECKRSMSESNRNFYKVIMSDILIRLSISRNSNLIKQIPVVREKRLKEVS